MAFQFWSSTTARRQRMVNRTETSVFHKALRVNSEAATEGVGEGTGGDGEAQADEVEHRQYGYKDPVIQVLQHSYMHIWGTTGEHIGWRKHKDWTVKCKSADIHDAPESTFRR